MIRAIVMLGLAGALALFAGAADSEAAPNEMIVIRYSQFEPAFIEVPAGVPVRITLVNEDPIEHEWIVGPPEVHAIHRVGTEPYHDERPTEVTIPPLSTRVTTLTFAKPGQQNFICHLAEHEAYGMSGLVRVTQ